MSVISPTDKLIRKLRKKLRQIENLEFLGRSNLNEEELLKVKQKNATRTELAKILKQVTGETCVNPKPEVDVKQQETKSIFVPSERTDVVITPEKKTNTAITPEKKSKNETEKNPTSTPLLEVPLQSKKVKPLKDLQSNTPTTILNPAITETMKRPSIEESTSSVSPESSTVNSSQTKKPKAEIPESQEPKKTKPNNMQKETKQSPATKAWHETPFLLNMLESHNDIVCCVDLDENYIISGSRDTLVQVWCAKTGSALMDLRGHTNTVTCVCLLSAEESKNLCAVLSGTTGEEAGPRLALSSSSDCCLKLWNLENGSALRSIYTFSAVTALCYLPAQQCCVVGSEGGKLEIYSFLEENTHAVFSIKTFESSVSYVKLQGDNLICSSHDGFISVWSLKGTELCRLFKSDDLVSETGVRIYSRPILSLAVNSTHPSIFYGDEGASVKMLTWKTGFVKKLRNHVHDFGITNAIYVTKSFLLSSSIDLDTGNSSVNVRSLPDGNYLGTLNITGVGRIVCLAATEDPTDQSLRLVIGGTKLLLLETRGIGCRRSPKKDSVLNPQFIKELNLPVGDSEDDSSSSSDEEFLQDQEELANSDETDEAHNESAQNSSWCTIL
ncbi:kinesin-like protein KIF21A [Daphnia pulex]|uniref:kinesin-like protein KIF21A n=1 Tax=Daphnia pulex TaxID=6669 RepID=UPI001EE03F4E|nr:kinesin-like protein KIF21A [Daphnia pulex]